MPKPYKKAAVAPGDLVAIKLSPSMGVKGLFVVLEDDDAVESEELKLLNASNGDQFRITVKDVHAVYKAAKPA